MKLQIDHGQVYCQNGFNLFPCVLATLITLKYMDVSNSNLAWRTWLDIDEAKIGYEGILGHSQPVN